MASKNGVHPDPTQMKLAKGNPGKRKEEIDLTTEAQPIYGLPEKPSHISEEGIEQWDRLGPILEANKLITIADGETFATLCENLARRSAAEIQMQKEEMIITNAAGTPIINPLLNLISKLNDTLYKYFLQFGMTPAARAKIRFAPGTFPEGDQGGKKESDLEKFKREQGQKRKENLTLVA